MEHGDEEFFLEAIGKRMGDVQNLNWIVVLMSCVRTKKMDFDGFEGFNRSGLGKEYLVNLGNIWMG